jgi:oligopeptide/dipeptide ABC transporter ATP-binding protein
VRRFAQAYLRAPSGIFSLLVLAILGFFAAFAPALFGHAANTVDVTQIQQPPSWEHWLGTDRLGRDLLARILVATRLSLGVGLGAAGISLLLGGLMGISAAVLSPRLRTPLLRFIDGMIAFPALLKAIVIGVIIGIGAGSVVLGIGVALSFSFARTASTLALSAAGREYISAARVVGVGKRRLMLRYVMPNIAEPLILLLAVQIGFALLAATGLSFLGVGIQPPNYDWGRILNESITSGEFTTNPAPALVAASAVALSALAFNYAGEAAARAMNPLLWSAPDRAAPTPEPAAAPAAAVSANGARAAPTNGSGQAAVIDAPDAALTVRDLVVSFGPVDVVKGLSFTVARGEMIGIVGESGSGKTMTALAISQLTPYPGQVGGTITLHGRNLRELSSNALRRVQGTELAVVFQDPMSSLNPALTVGSQLTEAARLHRKLTRHSARSLAVSRLGEVHIPTPERQLKRYPHELSGGMRQRAMIAMGLMNEPSLLICDEPTTALDVTIQAQIMDLLNEVNQTRGTAIVLISHNLALVSQSCHRVLVMYAGRIVEDLDADQLTTDPQHPYTRALLGAVPKIERDRGRPLEYIPGEAADVSRPPPGCPYHPRCPLAIDRCRAELPSLVARPHERGRRVACHVANDGGV